MFRVSLWPPVQEVYALHTVNRQPVHFTKMQFPPISTKLAGMPTLTDRKVIEKAMAGDMLAIRKSTASQCFACKSRFTKINKQYETI